MGKKSKARLTTGESPAGEVPEGAPAPAASPDPASAPRRSLLLRSGLLAVGSCGLLLAGGALRTALPDFGGEGPGRFALGPLADFRRGSLTFLREARLFVLHDSGGFGAFSSRCTHLGCSLRRTAEGFACPCHGARFDARGAVLSGPPRRPLPWFALSVDLRGELWIDLRHPVPARTAPPRRLELEGEASG